MAATVTPLDRAPSRRAVEEAKQRHPALRWIAGAQYWLAHRRDPDSGTAACGADGDLVRATPAVPLCPTCYPRRAAT